MSQQEFERQLAEATGEDVRTIRRGFQLMTPLSVFDPEPDYMYKKESRTTTSNRVCIFTKRYM